jgi:glucose/mannose-6-phosphate isomerase
LPVALLPKGIQPRAALPVIFSIILPIVEVLIGIGSTDFSKLSVILDGVVKRWGDEIISPRNLAERTSSLVPLFIGSGHLVPVSYRAKCQINENAKTVAFSAELPEANHNEIEASYMYQEYGIVPIFLRSTHESKRISARFDATDAVYRQSDCAPIHVRLSGLSELEKLLRLHTTWICCQSTLQIFEELTLLELTRLRNLSKDSLRVCSSCRKPVQSWTSLR